MTGRRPRPVTPRTLTFAPRDADSVATLFADYVKGEALQNDRARLRLVHRLPVGFQAESAYVSGRAFRELSDLADAEVRTLVTGLPAAAMSREP